METEPWQAEDDVPSFRELREYAQGNLDVDHSDLHPIAGLIEDREIREVLAFMAESYDATAHPDLPASFWDTAFAQKAIRKHATDLATKAISEGNLSQVSYLTGLPSYKSDVSGLHAINDLADWLVHSEQCKLIYMAALMGRGKTDLAILFLQVIADHYNRLQRSVGRLDDAVSVPTPEFATNFWLDAPDDVEHRQINSWPSLLRWAEHGSSDDVRWFIFDEASTELTAQSGENAQDVAETMGPFVKKMRKNGINMIVIGHDKRDVHPAIRSMADFVDKTGLKTASFYAGIQKREPVGHMFDVEGIPRTAWDFNTDDMASWSWGHGQAPGDVDVGGPDELDDAETLTEEELKDEIAERGARVYLQTELSQQDVANALSTDEISVSRSTIARRAKDLEASGSVAQSRGSA